MGVNTISFLAFLIYSVASLLQFLYLFSKLEFSKTKLITLGTVAITLHGYVLYRWINTPIGQNLSSSHLFSLVCWLISITALIGTFRKTFENLILFILPIAACSILLGLLFPGSAIFHTKEHPIALLHVLSAILAFGILGMAALQASLLYFQNYFLKNHSGYNMVRIMPPLESMEKLLFNIIWIGFFLLTTALLSVFLLPTYLGTINYLQKIILSLLAWSLFGFLLYGHYRFGLRGTKAILWTLGGVGLLVLAYYVGKWYPMKILS